MLLKDI
jgi:hypothetical protein